MKNILKPLLVTLFISAAMVSSAEEVDVSALKKRCDNITAQQRQLAQAAGFDISSMCSKLNSAGKKTSGNEELRTERPNIEDYLEQNRSIVGPRGGDFDPQSIQFYNEFSGLREKERQSLTENEEDIELERYGYNLFSGAPTTFAPVTDIPVPVDYVIGVGDTVQIQLLGKIDNSYELPVNRDGSINLPELGPINVAGLKYSEAKSLIKEKVSSRMIGVTTHVTLGELRSIRVFVLGEAFTPGSYTVSSLSSMTNAIFVSGGVTEIASLRNIQLKRKGKLISTLDLYDLLQKGDTSNDRNLQSGDVIYIPPASQMVGVRGEVNRPAIYEIKKGESLKDLVSIAGGYTSEAYPGTSFLKRNGKDGFKTVLDADLNTKAGLSLLVESGDELNVSSTLDQVEDIIELSGHFHRPRQMKWQTGMRVADVIKSVTDFKDNPELGIGLIVRKEMPLRKITLLHFNIEKMLQDPAGEHSLLLKPLDQIIVLGSEAVIQEDEKAQAAVELERLFSMIPEDEEKDEQSSLVSSLQKEEKEFEEIEPVFINEDREDIIKPLVEKIQQQASGGSFAELVEINGNVKFPGIYPKSSNMTVKDLVLLAGGLQEATYLGNIEITRRDMSNHDQASIEHINIVLSEQLTEEKSFHLEARDKVAVYVTPEYSDDLTIEIEGQVKFPGNYEFKQGETLSQVIKRAGGFNSNSHAGAAIFTREDLRLQEEKQLEDLRSRLKRDIVASELEEKAAGNSTGVGQAEQLLDALGETEAIGRLVIDLEKMLSGEIIDIQLKPGDRLVIPSLRQEVSVLGEVQHSTSHIFNNEWTIDDYLEGSGGLTKRADDDRIYVVRADGSVFLPNQGGWLTHQNTMLSAGDTIVVPQDTDRIKSLTLWTQVSQVIYQLSLGAAAISRL